MIIRSATQIGVVLAATFTVLGVLPLVFLSELGFAVSFGVLLDTLLVRSLLVPALTLNLGKRIWAPSALSKTVRPALRGDGGCGQPERRVGDPP